MPGSMSDNYEGRPPVPYTSLESVERFVDNVSTFVDNVPKLVDNILKSVDNFFGIYMFFVDNFNVESAQLPLILSNIVAILIPSLSLYVEDTWSIARNVYKLSSCPLLSELITPIRLSGVKDELFPTNVLLLFL